MPVIIVILLLSVSYVGCSGHPARHPDRGREPAPYAREVRLAPVGELSAAEGPAGCGGRERLRRVTGLGLFRLDRDGTARPSLAAGWTKDGDSWTLRIDNGARDENGSPVTSADVSAAWRAALADPCSPVRWLLGPLVGVRDFVSGARAIVRGIETPDDRTLTLRMSRPVPDLPERLSHPSLEVRGAGPFRRVAGDRLQWNPVRGRRKLPAPPIRLLRDEPSLLLRVGEADAAVVYGSAVEPFVAGARPDLVAERSPAWDRVYALWLNPASTALRDDTLRARVTRAIDREATALSLFGTRATPASSLLGPTARAVGRIAVPGGSSDRVRPEVGLLYRPDDAAAGSIAARIRAELLQLRWNVRLEQAADETEYFRRLDGGEFEMTLFVHADTTPDALLALGLTLSRLGSSAADALAEVARATLEPDPAVRDAEAARIESSLIEQCTLMPLVRVQAWLVHDVRLAGLHANPWLQLTLEQMRWTR